ncbi:MAG: sodium:solute symporter family protein, partial [Bacillota bacterium]
GMFGMGLLWLTFLNIFVGIFLAFVVFGKRTLIIGRKIGANTFPEFLGKVYDSTFIRKFAATIILCAMPLYAAAVMIGAARFLESTLNMNYTMAVIIFAVIVAAYVMTGGIKGVFYTDAFQGSIMFIGMLILLFFTYNLLGGVSQAHNALTNLNQIIPASLAEKGHLGWTSMPAFGSEYWWVLVSTLVLGVGIGVLAQPQLIVRYLTVKGPKELNRAVVVGGIFIIAMTGIAFVVGALTNVYFYGATGKIALLAAVDPVSGKPNIDLIIPMYINMALPPWFTYIFMLTLLSAAMSTLSGQFHSIGTSLGHDLSRRASLLINRASILVALVVTVWLSFVLPPGIVAIATAIFFGICAATFLPAYAAALYWKRATRPAAIASMVTGFGSSLLLIAFVHAKEASALGLSQLLFGRATLLGFPWTVVDPIVISLPLAALVMMAVSLVTAPATSHSPAAVLTETKKARHAVNEG